MRVLVAIAHHGFKNRPHLLRMLETFAEMTHDVDVVVVCEEPKDLPPHVEQVVGLPTSDPWSLPFAHRPIFVERADDYDLFVYSEDDTLIEQRHLDTFVELQGHLPDDVITGFMRFEEYPDGKRSYCTVHSHYRWLPNSAQVVDGLTFARFTNEHAACYALTQEQLRRAIASGGFLVEPHAGRYDMLVSAATDVYTRCGMTKYFCVDMIEDHLVHHMPNVYLGKLGVGEEVFQSQLRALRSLADQGTNHRAVELFSPETRTPDAFWDRHSFASLPTPLLTSLTGSSRRILNVGATTGDLEVALQHLGHEVSSVPMDAVFRHVLESRDINTLPMSIPDAASTDARFDHVLMIDVLPYLEEPVTALRSLRHLLTADGRILASVPDHRRYHARNLMRRQGRVSVPRAFARDGIHFTSPPVLRRWMDDAGLQVQHMRHRRATRRDPIGSDGWMSRPIGNVLLAVATPRA